MNILLIGSGGREHTVLELRTIETEEQRTPSNQN
ncbi:MAG: phosphoribosylamine-glycine ligase [Granulosicoccus sp.]|jgi:phosphoribosylamine-glycine ligase